MTGFRRSVFVESLPGMLSSVGCPLFVRELLPLNGPAQERLEQLCSWPGASPLREGKRGWALGKEPKQLSATWRLDQRRQERQRGPVWSRPAQAAPGWGVCKIVGPTTVYISPVLNHVVYSSDLLEVGRIRGLNPGQIPLTTSNWTGHLCLWPPLSSYRGGGGSGVDSHFTHQKTGPERPSDLPRVSL